MQTQKDMWELTVLDAGMPRAGQTASPPQISTVTVGSN
jgi:hypothetical protein